MVISYVAWSVNLPAVCNFRPDRENPYRLAEKKYPRIQVSSEKPKEFRK
jgi:hypothetical protein